ncbi:MAG: AAA family ATPase [Bacteroidetes bacterium]|nr:AAA family ATPase [Bacteroidota bacterium]
MIVLISGLPATGKTTLAQTISQQRAWPVLGKDMVKEELAAHIAVHDRLDSRRLGILAEEILLRVATVYAEQGLNCIIESTFRPEFIHDHLSRLASLTALSVIVVQCERETMLARFVARETRDRVHYDVDVLDELRSMNEISVELFKAYTEDVTIKNTSTAEV